MDESFSAFLQVVNVSKQVTSGNSLLTILREVNLTVKQGETVAIIGRSGSGKTTLLTLIAGLDVPSHGQIIYRGRDFSSLKADERALIRSTQIGFIFQNFQLLPNLTALENVMLPLELQFYPFAQVKEQASYWLDKVGLQPRMHHYPTQLSGGEEQRVAIARAFVSNPLLLLADEMTGNLDVETGRKISDMVFDLNHEQKTTLLLVTHEVELAERCNRKFVLTEGELHEC